MDIKKNNTKFIIFEIIVIMLGIIGVTFAVSYVMKSINVNVDTAQLAVDYTGNLTLPTANLVPIEDSSVSTNTENVMRINFTVKGVSSNPNIPIIYDVILSDLQIDKELKNEYLKWELEKNGVVISSGSFSPWFDSMKDNKLWLTEIQQDLPTSSQDADSYEFRLWISESCTGDVSTCTEDMDQSNMLNKTISGKIETVLYTKGKEALVREVGMNASEYVTNIFTSASKTTVTNNSVEYQYAPSVGMMEDIGGNIRYYGADPNNYVSFNNELWRIIGVFNEIDDGTGKTETRIKIARSESIGNYQWDDNENEWSTATLNTYLNGTYLNSLSTESQAMIGDAKWNLGGSSSYRGLYANDYYTFERGTTVYSGRSTEWTGKIALMYPSDYMYAGDLSKCSKDGYNWNTDQTNCRDTSWLRNTSYTQWTLTPLSSNSNAIYRVNYSGFINLNAGVTSSHASRPVLYLASTVEITGGDGTSGNPFTLS